MKEIKVQFTFPEDPSKDFAVNLLLLQQFGEFMHKKYPKIQGFRNVMYDFDTNTLVVERNLDIFLKYWKEFLNQYARVEGALNAED